MDLLAGGKRWLPPETRILVTGGGGAAAVAVVRALLADRGQVLVADIDPHAVGLYLVPAARRVLLPRADDADFVERVIDLCDRLSVDVLVPTVDAELLPLAGARATLERGGTRIVLADRRTLEISLDKLELMRHCAEVVPVPRSAALDEDFRGDDWRYPLIVKPRSGSGGRGVQLIGSPDGLSGASRDGSLLVQEHLPGEEYSVDVFADRSGRVRAAVPRARLKVDSGVAVAARTVHDPELEHLARTVAERIGVTYVANVQFRRDREGIPRLLEVNPRFPGTMPLTVQAGVPMPRLALEAILGRETWPDSFPFREVAVVRYWNDVFIHPSELASALALPPRVAALSEVL